MKPCTACGHVNQEWTRFCISCGTPLLAESLEDAAHIAWVLARIPEWRRRGLIPPGSAARLAEECRRQLPGASDGGSATPPRARPTATGPLDMGQSAEDGARASGVAPPEHAPTGGRPSGGGIAEFLEQHWLKLLAVLAAAFIFAGMRQVVGWEWVSEIAVRLIPAVPLGLSIALIRNGLAARGRGEVGSRAYCSVGVVLATFAVTSVNRRWLDGTVPAPWALATGCGLSTALAAWVRERSEDRSYEHFVFGGLALTVVLLMHAVLPIGGMAEAQRWYYAAAMLAVAAPYLAVATWRATASLGHEEAQPTAGTAFLWGHLCIAASAAFALLPMASGRATPLGGVTVVALAGGVYVICARLIRDASLAYTGGGALALAGLLALDSSHLASTWSAWAVMLTVLGLVAAALMLGESRVRAVLAEPVATDSVVAAAYGRMSLAAFACAGGCLVCRVLQDVSDGRSIAGPEWPAIAVPAAICAAAYTVAAIRARTPEILLAAALMAALAVGLFVHRVLAQWPVPPAYRFCHDLAPAAALFLVAAHSLRRLGPGHADEERVAWARPLVTAMLLSSALALAVAGIAAGDKGVTPAFWLAAGTHTLLLLVAAWLTVRWPGPDMPQSLATAGLAGTAVMAGWGAWSACHGRAELAARYAATALAVFGLACAAAAALGGGAGRTSPPSPSPYRGGARWLWALPLQLVGSVALAACTTVSLAHGLLHSYAQPGPYETALLCAVAAALVAVSIASRMVDSVSISCSIALLGTIAAASGPWVTPARPQALALVIGSALCAGGYWAAAWRKTAGVGWIAAIAGSFAWLGFTQWLLRAPEAWWCLAQAPWLLALYATGDRLRNGPDVEVGRSARITAVALAIVMLAVGATHGAVVVRPWWAMTVTLAAFSLAFATRIWYRPSAYWTALAAGTALVAVGRHLIVAGWSAQSWSVAVALAAGAVVIGGRLLELTDRTRLCAAGAYAVAALAALVALVSALAVVSSPGAGEMSVLAVALAGTVWAALFALGRGAMHAHAAFAAYLLAYAIFLYDRVSLDAGVLDLYLIPVGVYLVVLGHIADVRGKADEAPALWWLGLLMTMTPTCIAFYVHFAEGGTSLHAVILIAECLSAVLWGIARRIRSFVACGTLFALAFAAVLTGGAVKQVWAGLVALATGLVLLMVVYYLSTRSAEARTFIDRAIKEWRRWK